MTSHESRSAPVYATRARVEAVINDSVPGELQASVRETLLRWFPVRQGADELIEGLHSDQIADAIRRAVEQSSRRPPAH